MKTFVNIKLKSVLLLALFMVLCLGKTVSAAENSSTKVQLHVPWNLLSERLRTIGESNNSVVKKDLESAQLVVEGFNLDLSKIAFAAKLSVNRTLINETGASIGVSNSLLDINVERLSIDQVIQKEINGIVVRVHLKANCGPIVLHQNGANAAADLRFDWSGDDPSAEIASLDLNWAPGSWTLEDFSCTGPNGLDSVLHDEIVKRFNDAKAFKPYLVSFLSAFMKAQTVGVMQKLRSPLTVKAGSSMLRLLVGKLVPTSSGVVANISVSKASDAVPAVDATLPTDSTLSHLPKDRPAIVGDLSALQFMMHTELSNRPDYLTVDLQQVSAFAKLMKSRFLQFFVWRDLWKYPKTNPFYLRIKTPSSLTLEKSSDGSLKTSLSLYSVIQSYRDSKWWSYVIASANADASVALSVANGVMTYSTTLEPMNLKMDYGPEYKTEYKPSGSPPGSLIKKALQGQQPALSGSMKWPSIDFGVAGKFEAASFVWIDENAFYLTLEKKN
jgi:hypothetical protein